MDLAASECGSEIFAGCSAALLPAHRPTQHEGTLA
jgi:hypothetical protein